MKVRGTDFSLCLEMKVRGTDFSLCLENESTRWHRLQSVSGKSEFSKSKKHRLKSVPLMSFLDILNLALRNLRQARLRATLTTMGVVVGVAVIVTMISFGLGLQRNMLARFSAL